MNILWMPVLPPTLNLNMEVKESLMHKLECNGIKLGFQNGIHKQLWKSDFECPLIWLLIYIIYINIYLPFFNILAVTTCLCVHRAYIYYQLCRHIHLLNSFSCFFHFTINVHLSTTNIHIFLI